MKRRIALVLCSVMAVSLLAGCGNRNETPASGDTETSTDEDLSQIANPMEAWDSLAAAEEAAGFAFAVPDVFETFEIAEIYTIDRAIIDVTMRGTDENDVISFRKARGEEDISGDYNDYDAEDVIWAGDYEVTGKGNEGLVMCTTWRAGEYTYAGSFPSGWDGELVASLICEIMAGEDVESSNEMGNNCMETGDNTVLAEVPGPYGCIRLTIPAGWMYAICEVGQVEMATADYGIRLWPKDIRRGWMELGYTSSFGVCGTGLVTEERIFSGAKATEGHFDGNEVWDYIAFHDKLENLVVVQNQADEWLAEYDQQITAILDSVEFDTDALQGAVGVYDPASELESLGLQVIVAEVDKNSAKVTYCQYDDQVEEELGFGQEFAIEVRSGDDWQAYPVKRTDMSFTQELLVIEKNAVTEKIYDWADYYGALPAGDYRLRLTVLADSKPYDVYAEFIVR